MGYRLLGRVQALGMVGKLDGLSDRAHLVLRVMAAEAHDQDDAPTYFAGWDHLAEAALLSPYDDRAQRAVARALKELGERGLVEQTGRHGGPRGPRRYELHLPSIGRL